MSRHVPIRYERDFWPVPFERRLPIYHDPYPSYDYRYNYSRDPVPFEFERPVRVSDNSASVAMESEMRRMGEEMRRMCDSMSRNVVPAPLNTPTLTSVTHTPFPAIQQSSYQTVPSVDDWRLSENFRMDNPIVQERDGARKFYLEFDVSHFKPEEISVKTSGNQLSIHARHDEKDPSRQAYREFSRQYVLPKEVKPEFLTSKLSERGKLTIEAPLPALSNGRDKMIPIEHRK